MATIATGETMHKRQGTDVRQRQAQVGVRLLPEEMAELRRLAEENSVSPAEILRRAVFASV